MYRFLRLSIYFFSMCHWISGIHSVVQHLFVILKSNKDNSSANYYEDIITCVTYIWND